MFENIYGLYNNGELDINYVKKMVEHNLIKYGLKEDYYLGYQWNSPGIVTRAGMPAIDSAEKDKVYYGVVDNKIKEAADLLVSLSLGVSGVKVINNGDIKIDWDTIATELFLNLYKFKKAYFTMGFNGNGEIEIRVIPAMNSFPVKNKFGEIVEFTEVFMEGKKYNIKNHCYGYSDDLEDIKQVCYFREITDFGLMVEEVKQIMPVWEIDLGIDWMSSLIPIQDLINVKKTQAFEINKYEGDPFTQISGVKMIDSTGKQIDPRQLVLKSGKIIVTDTDGKVQRINGQGVTQTFVDEIKEEEKNFYKHAKLNGLRNDDLSGITSGYAIQLKMIDTMGLIRMARQKVLNGLEPAIKLLDELNGEEEYQIQFGNVIDFGLQDKINEGKGLKDLGYTDEEIKNYISL